MKKNEFPFIFSRPDNLKSLWLKWNASSLTVTKEKGGLTNTTLIFKWPDFTPSLAWKRGSVFIQWSVQFSFEEHINALILVPFTGCLHIVVAIYVSWIIIIYYEFLSQSKYNYLVECNGRMWKWNKHLKFEFTL